MVRGEPAHLTMTAGGDGSRVQAVCMCAGCVHVCICMHMYRREVMARVCRLCG